MIDFVSTRPGTNVQTQAAAHLLAAAIVMRIRDAATPPMFLEVDNRQNRNAAAAHAIEYLFRANSPFEDHLAAIGGSAQAMREALLSDRPLGEGAQFTLAQREIIQNRHEWWLACTATKETT